ncbi:MAG TPA: hypothetical protein VGO01_00510 [Bradyrhizobium sp.]|nr:hypothetical protein [Bradyrhizobium sp.]
MATPYRRQKQRRLSGLKFELSSMPMKLEDFDKLTSGLQHAVTTAGIVIGGVWVLYTFWGQHVLQKASLDVTKTQQEIKKIEQDSLVQPVLRIIISPGVTTDDGYPISVTAIFRNEGKRALNFERIKLSIMQLLDEKGLKAEKAHPIRIKAKILESDGTLSDMPARILRTGQERNVAFILPKLAAGTYFVELFAEYDGMDIVNGQFIKSKDETIDAREQTVLRVPIKSDVKTSTFQPVRE